MTRFVPQGMMIDFKKELKDLKAQGKIDKSAADLRQKVFMRIASKYGPKFVQENGSKVTAELNAAISEVRNG
ncbi:MAG: hypothetical protein ABFD24_09505 [Anaerolineaceae bacterium]